MPGKLRIQRLARLDRRREALKPGIGGGVGAARGLVARETADAPHP